MGRQEPTRRHLPDDLHSAAEGQAAVELARSVGVEFDPWQEQFLVDAMWTRPDGKWSAFEVAGVLPRQNGKGAILEGRELYGLFIDKAELIWHTAHQFVTSDDAFRRMREIIAGSRFLTRKVRRMPESHGEEGIYLHPTPTIIMGSSGRLVTQSRSPMLRYATRTGKAGRGLSSDCTELDEAFELPSNQMNALVPAMSARRAKTAGGPQLWYMSSAVNQSEHANGLTLAKLRARALGDLGNRSRLCYLEWQGDEAKYLALLRRNSRKAIERFMGDVEQWVAANPALGYRLFPDLIESEMAAMTTKGFIVERLNIGDWPPVEDEAALDLDRWDEIADPASRPVGEIALAVDVTPDSSWASIASAGRRADGKFHIKIVDHRQGTWWIADRLKELVGRHKVCAVMLDASSAAGGLIDDIHDVGIPDKTPALSPWRPGVVRVTAREMANACAALMNETEPEADGLRHCGQANLDDAVRDAATRPLADAWAWSRKDSGGDISPLVAVTLALRGYRVHGSTGGGLPWASRG